MPPLHHSNNTILKSTNMKSGDPSCYMLQVSFRLTRTGGQQGYTDVPRPSSWLCTCTFPRYTSICCTFLSGLSQFMAHFPIPCLFWLVNLRLVLVVEVPIHHRISVPVLFVEESSMPHVHHLLGCIKVSVASIVNSNYATGLTFDLPRQ